MRLQELKSKEERNKALSNKANVLLNSILDTQVDEKYSHCENLIGGVAIPLGVAGPLMLNGKKKREVYVPLATTEGALVASVNRGCKVATLSGGVNCFVETVGATRGPVFETEGIIKSHQLVSYILKNFDELADEAEETSKHLVLKDVETQINGPFVYVRFVFDTDEAMGMNMVTIATDKLVNYIELKTEAKCVAVAGNYDVDKKPSWLNAIKGRGRRVHAEVVVPKDIVLKELKVKVSELVKTTIIKCWGGSMMSGSMGYNAHFANVVAAFYAATGQDLAHVVEGSLGVTFASENKNGDLYMSIMMPDIMLGTVGGGTNLPTQKEAFNLTTAKSSTELAEVLAGAVLAGELSLLASITEKTLAKSHKKLGR
jgi:hydroxymethylglutaryl-CoA reductase (NADPH)